MHPLCCAEILTDSSRAADTVPLNSADTAPTFLLYKNIETVSAPLASGFTSAVVQTVASKHEEEDVEVKVGKCNSDDQGESSDVEEYKTVVRDVKVWTPSQTSPFNFETEVGEDGWLEAALRAMSAWTPQQLRGPRPAAASFSLRAANFD